MEESHSVLKSISERVHAFCDDIIAGKISDDLLQKHKISSEYLIVCRDTNHPSCRKLCNRLFEYLMFDIGAYHNIQNEEALSDIYSHLEDLLMNPQEGSHQQSLYTPRFIYGVKNTLDSIEKLKQSQHIDFPEKALVKDVQFGRIEKGFQLTYKKDHRVSVSLENVNTPATQIKIDGRCFEIPLGGGHLSSYSGSMMQSDTVVIQFDKFHSSNLNDNNLYYFRYITEVSTSIDLIRMFEVGGYDIDGADAFSIDTLVNEKKLKLYFYAFNGKRYLIIEYEAALTAKDMNDLSFSTLVAFGMITSDVHLDECWLAAYDSRDKRKELGFYYQSLVPTIHCNYQIFTTNVYPSLVHIAKRIDPINGEHRACDIIGKLKLSNALLEFPSDVFGRLVENMHKYEELQRGIFIVLMGSKLQLEIQAATYCVALEAISNLAPKIISRKEERIINDKDTWVKVRKRFRALAQELCEQQLIKEKEKKDIEKKIENMNKAFNSEKLRTLLEYYNYPLRQFDELTLFLRNLLLHGNINFKVLKGRKPEDYLFELSMNLHKLCCAIALLMSGYKGYIVNNRKLYNYPNSYKAFIRIGDNVKIEYPKYEKSSVPQWNKIFDTIKSIFRF